MKTLWLVASILLALEGLLLALGIAAVLLLVHPDVLLASYGVSLTGLLKAVVFAFVLTALSWLVLTHLQTVQTLRGCILETLADGPGSTLDLCGRIAAKYNTAFNHHRVSAVLRALEREGLVGHKVVPTHPSSPRGGLARNVYHLRFGGMPGGVS